MCLAGGAPLMQCGMGAVDVVPFIPVKNVTMKEAVELARRVAQEAAGKLGLPVFLYEESASAPHRPSPRSPIRTIGNCGRSSSRTKGIPAPPRVQSAPRIDGAWRLPWMKRHSSLATSTSIGQRTGHMPQTR